MHMNIPLLHTEEKHPIIALRERRTFGQRFSDNVTRLLGSWTFIILFVSYLVLWVGLNAYEFLVHAWDPFPFILLNLTLSCIAALQAPLILMSQNRQAERDRIAAKYDYAVNKKAEKEIQQALEELREIKALLSTTPKTTKTKNPA